MSLSREREEMIANYLLSDRERAISLLNCSPEEAREKINADGNDFTLEEIKEFGTGLAEALRQKANGDEFKEDDLQEVSGGRGNQMRGIADVCFFTGGALLGGAAVGIALFACW